MTFKRREITQPDYGKYIPSSFVEVVDNYNYLLWTFSPPSIITKLAPSWKDKLNPLYSELIEPLSQALIKIQARTNKEVVVIDTNSGNGKLIPLLSEKIKESEELNKVQFYLTDLLPKPTQWKQISQAYPNISFIGDSVDSSLPTTFHENWDKATFKIFLSHSRFSNFYAKKIIKDCFDFDEGFMIVETHQRETNYVIFMLIFLPVLIWFTAPFIIRPLSITKLFFTYFIPINILLVLFDNFARCSRARTLDEIEDLTKGLKTGKNWQFITGSYSGLLPFTYTHYLIGTREK